MGQPDDDDDDDAGHDQQQQQQHRPRPLRSVSQSSSSNAPMPLDQLLSSPSMEEVGSAAADEQGQFLDSLVCTSTYQNLGDRSQFPFTVNCHICKYKLYYIFKLIWEVKKKTVQSRKICQGLF